MCGIAGYFGTKAPDPARVERCLALMGRRGPDHAESRSWRGAGGRTALLLHSRLSIIDLDPRSHQPFRAGKKWVAYNGEVYNYLEAGKKLKGPLSTSSDTEVLLRTLEERGWEALDDLDGMWAFAVYDEGDGSVTLCRDRFGEKPLYLHRDATGITFGSEAKFVAALLGRKLPVNRDQVERFLVNGYKALYKEPRTFFEGLDELEPATHLRIGADGRESSVRYWKPGFRPEADMSYEEAVRGARERLLRSVETRLRADVPLAFCLSGGVDSNALAGAAKRAFGYDVHGFTIMNTDPRYEETALVQGAVQELGIRHTAVPVDTGGFLPRMAELVRQHDAPVYTITYYAQWLLMEAVAKEGYKISVSGTAADELFSGYYDHHLAYLYEARRDAPLLAASRAAWEREVKPWVRNPHLSDPDLFVKDPDFRGHIFLNADDFSACLKTPWSEPFRETRYAPDLLRNRMMNELLHESVPVILHEDDLNAMYYSIENRSPYLDRSLFEFCARIPTRHLVKDGRAKAVLRDAARGLAPDAVLDNPRKVGFNAPVFSYLDVKDPAVRGRLLADGPLFDVVRRESVQKLLEKAALPNSESKFLFNLVSVKLFLEEFA